MICVKPRNNKWETTVQYAANVRNRKRKTLIWAVLLFTAAAPRVLFGDGGGQETGQKEVVLQLKWYYQFQFAGYIAALEQGYFAEEGLDVELRQGGPDISPAAEVAEGRAHFGIENSEVLLHRLQGKPLIAMAAVLQHSPLQLLRRENSLCNTPHDFIGKKVMMGDGLSDIEIVAMFQQEGVPIESVEKLGYTLDPEDFLDPEIAAIAAYSTNTPYLLREAGTGYKTINPISYGIDFYSDVLFTNEKMMKREEETVLAFRRAAMKGWAYAMEHPRELAETLKSAYEASKTVDHLLYEAEAMRELMLPELIELGHMSRSRWMRIAETFVDLEMIDTGYTLDGFFYEDYLEISSELRRRAGLVSLAVFAGLLLIALFLLLYIKNLRRAVSERTSELSELNSTLRERERELTRAQRISRIGNWVMDIPSKKFRISEELQHIIGLETNTPSMDEFLGIIDPAYRTLVESLIEGSVETGKKTEIDYRIITPGGEDKIVRGIAEGIKDDRGNITQLYGTMQDITQRKIAEDQLHIQRDLALGVGGAAALEDAAALSVFGALELSNTDSGGVFILDEKEETVNLLYSEGFTEQFGEAVKVLPADTYFWQGLKGKKRLEIWEDQEDLTRLNAATGEGLKYAIFFPLSYRGRHFGSIGVASHTRSRLHRFERKALSDLTAQISNVIWQKKIEDVLRHSESRYRGLYQSLMYGVTQTDENGYIVESNKAFRDMLGYTEEELRNLRYPDITPKKWHSYEEGEVARQLRERGFSDEFEKEYYRKDGSIVPVAMRAWVNEIGPEAEPEFWALIHDISERKESEQIITKTMNDLARSNEELKQFAYVASHDLQEPLRAMTGFSELLKERYSGNLDDKAREFIDFIIDAAGRMQQLINDLLSYSRLNTRRRAAEYTDLNEVIETVRLNLTSFIQERGGSINVSGLPAVYCDKQQITQLFQNLVNNGLKYQPEGTAPEVTVSARELEDAWEFAVEDNGIGIKGEFLEVIFQVFQRLHTKDEYKGTGIGLAICRKIVERHGGTIWAKSKGENKGSIFYFLIRKGLEETQGESTS